MRFRVSASEGIKVGPDTGCGVAIKSFDDRLCAPLPARIGLSFPSGEQRHLSLPLADRIQQYIPSTSIDCPRPFQRSRFHFRPAESSSQRQLPQ